MGIVKVDKKKSVQLFFIHAKNCSQCAHALAIINQSIAKSGEDCQLFQFDSKSKEAINIGVNHGVDKVPGLVVGAGVRVFNDSDIYFDTKIIEAIKKAANE